MTSLSKPSFSCCFNNDGGMHHLTRPSKVSHGHQIIQCLSGRNHRNQQDGKISSRSLTTSLHLKGQVNPNHSNKISPEAQEKHQAPSVWASNIQNISTNVCVPASARKLEHNLPVFSNTVKYVYIHIF